ncbi:hypothetical protein Drorol1_Dr00020019, partial [Drosera rotundifolia]
MILQISFTSSSSFSDKILSETRERELSDYSKTSSKCAGLEFFFFFFCAKVKKICSVVVSELKAGRHWRCLVRGACGEFGFVLYTRETSVVVSELKAGRHWRCLVRGACGEFGFVLYTRETRIMVFCWRLLLSTYTHAGIILVKSWMLLGVPLAVNEPSAK